MGPTAAGKTQLAIELTQKLPCSIISVDSAMVYRGMDIGTAKPSLEERKIAPHALIDICDPKEIYSAGRFRDDAQTAIEQMIKEDKIPLLAGGTMLYFRTLQQGLSLLPKSDAKLRSKFIMEIQCNGLESLYARLSKIDPKTAAKINAGDKQRLLRALEIYELSGKPPSELYSEHKMRSLPYEFINIALVPKQKIDLDKKIEQRFDLMLKKGFLDEAECLFHRGDLNPDLPSMRAVGYRQAWQHLSGEINHNEMREKAIIATRQLAKRQMTWLRSWQNLQTFITSDANLAKNIYHHLEKNLA